jgi:hypothetical protein
MDEAQAREYLERTNAIAASLPENIPFITRTIMANDLLSAEHRMAQVQSGEMPAEQAIDLTGSYARLNFAIELSERNYLSHDRLLDLLPELWGSSDPDDTDPRFLALWMAAHRRNKFVALRDGRPLPRLRYLPVFRGQMPNAPKGIAWTLDPKIAQKFANGAGNRVPEPQGVVYRGFVAREHILAYLTRRGESEVIVNPVRILAHLGQ